MGWMPCYSTPLEFQAYLVKGFLEQFGVPCVVDTARFGLRPLCVGLLGEVRVLVREDFLQVAQGLIRGRESARRPRRRLVRWSES